MAGKYGSASITITYDSSPGGSGQVITNYVLTMGAIKIESNMTPSTAFGDSWEETLPVGMMKMAPITLTGFWDTTATTGPHVVFLVPDDGPQDATRTLIIVVGDSKTMTVETYLQSYSVVGKVGALTEFEALIQPTGAAVWS